MRLNKHVPSGSALALVLAVFVWATVAEAKTWRVDDDGKADFRVLAAAAAAAGNGDVIVIEPGVYGGAVDVSGKALTLRSRDPNDPRIVASTVIDCGIAGGYFVGDSSGGPAMDNTQVTIAGLTIRNASRGAVLCDGADLALSNCIFTNNGTGGAGGAIQCLNSRIRATKCSFLGNASGAIRGGAIYCSSSRLDVTSCTFENNKGCAVVNYDSQLNFTDCDFRKNSGEDGGAIHCRQDAPGSVAAALNLKRCEFFENAATASGGATYCYHVKATLDGCTFRANRSKQDGGAMYSSGANATLGNCVFVSNAAGLTGGAISTWYGSNLQALNCTFVDNTATTGGAVVCNGGCLASISHSIFWKNTAKQGSSLALVPNVFDYAGIASATVEYSDVRRRTRQRSTWPLPPCSTGLSATSIPIPLS